MQVAGDALELFRALTLGVDFQQLEVDGPAGRIVLQGVEQDFFRLGMAAISHVYVCFGNRVDAFVGFTFAHTGDAEVIGQRVGTGLFRGCAGSRVGHGGFGGCGSGGLILAGWGQILFGR